MIPTFMYLYDVDLMLLFFLEIHRTFMTSYGLQSV
jgi:hypothetical protein